MANITPLALGNAGALTPFAATAPGGDAIIYAGGDLIIEFNNGHSASITVNFAPNASTKVLPGVGRVTIPTRSLVIAASALGSFRFGQEDISAYLSLTTGFLPITYTGGNAAMTIRAFRS